MQILKSIEREEGQGLVEYALILVLVAVVVIIILTVLGSAVTLVFARVVGGLNGDTIDSNNDHSIFLTGDSTATGTGLCSGQLTNIKFVVVDDDGNIIKNSSVTSRLAVNGSNASNITGTADANGLATAAGPYTVSGTCPLNFTLTH